ncbi:hypothetical protein PsYK624_079720 [Phanerochaete sordida]|uniref:Uncharacterized protein n=1 Tax=Phanerochaete sordida TaxID=48140 RepID=A0A9P3GBH1_9APHY|nr:hypothetical protein PsYK624_079720 [Phanerochaete sordida]
MDGYIHHYGLQEDIRTLGRVALYESKSAVRRLTTCASINIADAAAALSYHLCRLERTHPTPTTPPSLAPLLAKDSNDRSQAVS